MNNLSFYRNVFKRFVLWILKNLGLFVKWISKTHTMSFDCEINLFYSEITHFFQANARHSCNKVICLTVYICLDIMHLTSVSASHFYFASCGRGGLKIRVRGPFFRVLPWRNIRGHYNFEYAVNYVN